MFNCGVKTVIIFNPAHIHIPENGRAQPSAGIREDRIMADTSIYRDIAERTANTFYLGVIGRV